MELFDIESGEVVLNPNSLYIKPFKEIWDRDKTKIKEKATKEISYVVFLCNFFSPYMAYRIEDRTKYIIRDVIRDEDWAPDKLVLDAIVSYKKFQETTNTRLLDSAKGVADKLTDYFKNIDFNLIDDDGKPVYSAKDAVSNLKSIGDVVKSLISLEKQVQKEQVDNDAARGDVEIGYFEIPRAK